jgi:hypothetical protein
MADALAALYIPIDSGRKHLAVAHPDARVEGRTSSVPSQLAGAAVSGQAGLEAMIKAGQLTARLVVVDPTTAKATRCDGHRQSGRDAWSDQGKQRCVVPDRAGSHRFPVAWWRAPPLVPPC